MNSRFSYRRGSVDSMASLDSAWDPNEEIHQAEVLGYMFLGTLVVCIALFIGGVTLPLVEVVLLPGMEDMEIAKEKSVWDMIALCFDGKNFIAGFVLLGVTVGIPMLLLAGILLILYENFWAVAHYRSTCFSPAWRALAVSVMYISTSYQVVILFLIMLFACFFTGFGTVTHLKWGFYCLGGYCLFSIAMLQAMEWLKLNHADEPDEPQVIPDPLNLRQRLSSFIPSLPGIKEMTAVDAFQVFCFCIIFVVLLPLGYYQPLLDIQIMYSGISFERRSVSLNDMINTLSGEHPVALWVFFALVIGIPALYSLVLCLAGIADTCCLCCCSSQIDRLTDCIEWILAVASFLRPWVMIDVFCISLVVVLYGVQSEYVSATIPEGAIYFGAPPRMTIAFGNAAKVAAREQGAEAWQEQAISGIFLIVGAGIAAFFLRWFWSTTRPQPSRYGMPSVQASRHDSHRTDGTANSHTDHSGAALVPDHTGFTHVSDGVQENWVTQQIASKSCRCLVVWAVSCFLLHGLPQPASNHEVQHIDDLLALAVPPLNKALKQYTPKTVGHCKYPAGHVPQPCFEYGELAKILDSSFRITAMWMSGLDTIQLTKISMKHTKTLTRDSSLKAGITHLHHYAVVVEGVWEVPGLFLKIESCPENHTTMKPITGLGKCKPFLETADSIHERNRSFSIELAAKCQDGDHGLRSLNVSSFRMDSMIVKPHMKKAKGHLEVIVAAKNITKTVVDTLSSNIVYYLTNATFDISGEEYDALRVLNRIMRFNALHETFHCG